MSVTTPTTTEPIRRQLAELRQQRAAQRKATAELRDRVALDPSPQLTTRFTRSRNAEDELTEQIEKLEQEERSVRASNGGGVSGLDMAGSATERLADLASTGELSKLAPSAVRFSDIPLGEIPRENVMTWISNSLAVSGTVTPTPGMGQAAVARVVPYPTPEPTFLSLVPTQPLDEGSYPYVQEIRGSGGPAPTPPGAIKPAVGLEYVDATATPETIAGTVKAYRQTLRDVPTLQSMIQTRLSGELRTALESEILSGDGSVSDRPSQPGIVGLLNTPGWASVPIAAGDSLLDAIRKAKTMVRVVGGVPNFCAINEADAEAVELTKSTGSGEYIANPFLTAAAQPLWGLTLTPGMGVPQGKVIVGDSRGFTLLMREPAQLYLTDSDQDDFVRNKITLRVELSAALAVWIPSFFAVVEVG